MRTLTASRRDGPRRRLAVSPLLAIAASLAFLYFLLPLVSVFVKLPPSVLVERLRTPEAFAALALSLRTSAFALVASISLGIPLAYWLSRSRTKYARLVETLMQMPVVVPPAVAGVGLLLVFGRSGFLGPSLAKVGITIPFTWIAVVLAQIFTGAPFFIVSAKQAFDAVDADLTSVARTLGSTPREAFVRITLPLAFSGLLGGAALCWARSLGEFGATIVFAGNYPGITQTLPLAIYTALDSSFELAVAMSALLLVVAFVILLAVRLLGGRAEARV
ncbi:MAG: ABC transporter permease [Vulcanimicrobiaceae bacterium]